MESHTFITATICQARTRWREGDLFLSLPFCLCIRPSFPTTEHHSELIIAEREWESEAEGDGEEEMLKGREKLRGQSHNSDNGAFDCDDNSVIITGDNVL